MKYSTVRLWKKLLVGVKSASDMHHSSLNTLLISDLWIVLPLENPNYSFYMGILTRVTHRFGIETAMAVRYWSGWDCTYSVAEAEEQMSVSATSRKKKGFCLSQHTASGRQELTAPLRSQHLWQHPSPTSFWELSHIKVTATNWNMLIMQCKCFESTTYSTLSSTTPCSILLPRLIS